VSQKSAKPGRKALNLTLAAVTSLVGCITVFITIAALILGLWLDAKFDSRPRLTVVITLASLPVTLITMFLVTRWTTSRMLIEPEKEAKNSEEKLG
jgi:MFS-type transporter involved in bile tolerance (Atg22 family)